MSDVWSRYEDTKMNKMQILALNCWFLPVQRWKQIVQRQLGCYECAIMVTHVWECRGDLGCVFRGDGVSSDIWSTVQVQHSKCKGLEVICSAVWVRKNTVYLEASNSRIRWLLLLLLSRFSRVRLCATPEMVAHQAPLSLGFSGQEHWSGLPFPWDRSKT